MLPWFVEHGPCRLGGDLIGWLSRILLIKDDERSSAFYFLFLFMLLGFGTAVGKGTADALFLKRFGIDYLALMYLALSPMLALASVVYAANADRLSAERLYKQLFKVLGAILGVIWLIAQFRDDQWIYLVYFLACKTIAEMLLVHGALYLNQNFDAQQAKRLTPPIMAGSQLGIILGGLALVQYSQLLGVENFILVWFVGILLAGGMIAVWHKRHGASVYFRPARGRSRGVLAVGQEVVQGARLLKLSPLLRVASLSLFFTVIAYYVLSYTVHGIYNEQFASEESLSAFYGGLVAFTSASTLLLQLLVTGRAIKRFGVRAVNLVFPISLLAVFSGLLVSMSLPFAILASFSRDTIMPAFRSPARDLFFNALPSRIQGRARALSLTLVMPVALLITGAFLWFTQNSDHPALVLSIGLLAAAFYLYTNLRMNRVYLAEILNTLRSRFHLVGSSEGGALSQAPGEAYLRELALGVQYPDESVSLAFAEAMIRIDPEAGMQAVLPRLPQLPPAQQDRLINMAPTLRSPPLREYLTGLLDHPDAHLATTALRSLCRIGDDQAIARLPKGLLSHNPRWRAAAIRGVVEAQRVSEYGAAARAWHAMLSDSKLQDNLAAIELADLDFNWAPAPDRLRLVYSATRKRLLHSPQARVRTMALRSSCASGDLDEAQLLDALGITDARLRLSVVRCATGLDGTGAEQVLYRALNDAFAEVRLAAAKALFGEHKPRLLEHLQSGAMLAPRQRDTLLHYLLELKPRHDELYRLADAWAGTAQEMASLRLSLQPDLQELPIGRLLLIVLKEREKDFIDLTLMAVSPMEGVAEVGVIRAALSSGDRRHIASAREVLQYFRHRELAHRLDRLLDGDIALEPLSAGRVRSRLDELANRSDDWLRACVKQLTDQTGDH